MSRERSFAVASLMGGHSRVTEVCVMLRTCSVLSLGTVNIFAVSLLRTESLGGSGEF